MTESGGQSNEKKNNADPNESKIMVNNMDLFIEYDTEELSKVFRSRKSKDVDVATEFMKSFDFRGMDIIEAFRFFNEKVCLTGDSNELLLMTKPFSQRFSELNLETWSFDKCDKLVCTILFLNASLHNAQKNVKPIELKRFSTIFANMNEQHSFSDSFKFNLYKSIRDKPITLPIPTRTNKRSPSSEDEEINGNKKQKNDFVSKRHFGIDFLSRKVLKGKEGKILDKTLLWKKFFVSLTDLSLSFYKDDDIKEYIRRHNLNDNINGLMENIEFMTFVRESTPVETMSICHCLAKPIVNHDTKFLLYLMDDSKYCFKAKDSVHVEYWNSTINYAAALLSVPRTAQINTDIFCFGRLRFNTGITKYDINEQIVRHCKERDEVKAMLNYHENVKIRNSLYKLHLKIIKLLVERFETYIRHLKVANSKPPLGCLNINLCPETDSITTCSSQYYCGSEVSSRSSIIIDSLSHMPGIGASGEDSTVEEGAQCSEGHYYTDL